MDKLQRADRDFLMRLVAKHGLAGAARILRALADELASKGLPPNSAVRLGLVVALQVPTRALWVTVKRNESTRGCGSIPFPEATRLLPALVKSQQKGDTFSSSLKVNSPGVESDDEGRASADLANRVLPLETTV
jgi:hypothetical protein